VKIRIIAALLSAGFLAACSSGTPFPAGWQPVPGASPNSEWSSGSGPALQTYVFSQMPFTGTLQELASQQAAAIVKANKGSRFVGSDIFGPCPGQAALENFGAAEREMLVGLAVRNNEATLVTYSRPANTGMGPDVAKAFEKALCGPS
jgi:hypothetical protein